MICITCGNELEKLSIYCPKCGTKAEIVEAKKLPKMLTVEEAANSFFGNSVSKGFLYECCRTKELPHVRMHKGKILLDEDKLVEWWSQKLDKSTEKSKVIGLRKID